MNKTELAVLSAATTLAKGEGITDEEALVTRAQEIFLDAQLDAPVTEQGKQAKADAEGVLAAQETNQVTGKPKFDYDAFRTETTMPAIVAILKKVPEFAENLPVPTKTTPEQEKAIEDAYNTLSLEILKILNENGVGMAEYGYVFAQLSSITKGLEDAIKMQVNGHRHEIISRVFGAKNPGTEKFDSNYATYENLTATLEKVRAETGGKLEDYFDITKE